jgi:hypothetical protein
MARLNGVPREARALKLHCKALEDAPRGRPVGRTHAGHRFGDRGFDSSPPPAVHTPASRRQSKNGAPPIAGVLGAPQ